MMKKKYAIVDIGLYVNRCTLHTMNYGTLHAFGNDIEYYND